MAQVSHFRPLLSARQAIKEGDAAVGALWACVVRVRGDGVNCAGKTKHLERKKSGGVAESLPEQ